MPKYTNVIIFGATGDVGSAAALQAHQEGATVSLAMRNTSKPIPQLDHLPFKKYQADLTQPSTLKTAVREANAQAAFIYGIFSGPDYMRSALRALKEAGVEFIVFLSSFIILTDIHAVDPSDIVPWEHAQVEIALEEVYGRASYVAVRPAFYASNILHEKQAILQGEVKHPNPEATFDFISSEDIGHVAGTILVNGAQEHIVRLLGPEKMTLRDAVNIVGNVLGKEVRVTKISREEAAARMKAAGVPVLMVQWHLYNVLDRARLYLESPEASTARENFLSYAHRPLEGFRQWVENNRARFLD
ncbi:NAD(P)-binding protein [Aspergillus sclerotioniger CBS 115572]|uniref:NAD(P)-binding protein n=1 Tax=Aspergillus sclerotioniger CBS 115572 TaxID=1450535 RepID=A0A317WYH2_9EURO|nr:NAD(P)-binding protein [Aspergillus sclerotioniger CBS 115572]PWY90382.1 NAD(P)-binding protein [Aspergillus sclerotioniger CBS 115572]